MKRTYWDFSILVQKSAFNDFNLYHEIHETHTINQLSNIMCT